MLQSCRNDTAFLSAIMFQATGGKCHINFREESPSQGELLWCCKGFVDKTDDYSGDNPLEEVSHSLSQREFQPDVQVHVVVQDRANRENANKNAEARTFHRARPALMYHCENYGDNQDRYERCSESK